MTRPRPAHVLMVSVPAHGHVNPSLAVIAELVARGHRVSYVNDPSFRELVESTGAEFVPYGTKLPFAEDPSAWPADPVGIQEVFLDDALAMWPVLLERFGGEDRPDVVLCDIAGYAGRVLGERLGVPVVQLSPTYVGWEGFEQDLPEIVNAVRAAPGGAAHYRRFADWLAGAGAVQRDVDAFKSRPERAIALVPRALQPHADRVDGRRISFVGPCFGDRAHQGEWKRPDGAEKVLLVSLGSAFTHQPAFYRACVEAFGALPGWHTVLQIGRHTDLAELGELPPGVEVHRWVPQLSVLAQADAFVTHAGMGGSSEGLFHAVPMIAVPQGADQFANADALVALGVARRLEVGASPEALRAALLELVGDPAVAERLAALSAAGRAEGGTARAADLIEAELGR
ncbi:macrolide family glycosyltransferase [Streptomyces sp. NRRL WC-3742]|uniref:macrolide family glycosyltransferase n=1 Tax=Streptomyces sp. NRRL WC-3742 TaxID=1463934 RepID=UPI0004CC653F|nr:macrolide family glycosyltransferase [Streptomyces sp. NRRL WC-3742]